MVAEDLLDTITATETTALVKNTKPDREVTDPLKDDDMEAKKATALREALTLGATGIANHGGCPSRMQLADSPRR